MGSGPHGDEQSGRFDWELVAETEKTDRLVYSVVYTGIALDADAKRSF